MRFTKDFLRGWAFCAAYTAGPCDRPDIARELAKMTGISLKDLMDADCDEYDISLLIKANVFREEWSLCVR